MTHAEEILAAVATLIGNQEKPVFTREEIRHQAVLGREEWNASYSPIFQGMRADHPGGAPKVNERFRGVFQQVSHGKHTLTEYGRLLLRRQS